MTASRAARAWFSVAVLSATIAELSILGCSGDERGAQYSRTVFTHHLRASDTLTFHSSDSVFITRTAQIASWREWVLISDFYEKKVWIFDTLMAYKSFIGRRGGGPGEFLYFPTIISALDYVWLLDGGLKRATRYGPDFTVHTTQALPSGYFFRREGIFRGGKFILAMQPARMLEKVEDLRNEHPITVLDGNFQEVSRFWEWDDGYFENTIAMQTFAYQNADILLASGWDEGFFGLQKAVYWVTHFNRDLEKMRKFGTKPGHWKDPPSIPYEQTAYSPEMISNYAGSTTQFLKLDCDTLYRRVFVNYVNLDSSVFFERTMLAGKHYLQIYNEDYDCIFDGEIPGKLAFVRNGKVYVQTHEEPEFIRFVVFTVAER
jgi:hypothetical protein